METIEHSSQEQPEDMHLAGQMGGTAVEYAILAALIAAVIAGIVGTLGQRIVDLFTVVEGAF